MIMKQYPLMPADVLLPKKDFEKWAVVACDQFTSEHDYWENVEGIVSDNASTFRIILPEIYLEDNLDKRISKINETMDEYLCDGVFETYENSMIYVERMQSNGLVRHGIVGLIDLEQYDYHPGSNCLIRATEQTVVDRIPPRVKIRKDAFLELPHVMLLIDDPEHSVTGPLKAKKQQFKKAYDFELMLGGGHINGYFTDEESQKQIGDALNALVEGKQDKLLFAVGDGNHSLATAKECYNATKSDKARYALVEVVNIHDQSIEFEPIYRVLFGDDKFDTNEFIKEMLAQLGDGYSGEDAHKFQIVTKDVTKTVSLKPTSKLPVSTLQAFLDKHLSENQNVKIDYIHGEKVVKDLCKEENTIGFIFEGMKKDQLFDAVSQDGSLVRKTFSMGHASDKRYYIECRKIK